MFVFAVRRSDTSDEAVREVKGAHRVNSRDANHKCLDYLVVVFLSLSLSLRPHVYSSALSFRVTLPPDVR